MADGSYRAAIPILQKAAAAATPGSLWYAYALYDLGRSLRLAGDPQSAIAVLQRRLQIPNQVDVVRRELAAALQAAGAGRGASGTAAGSPPAAVAVPGFPLGGGQGRHGGGNGGNGGNGGGDGGGG
jgi:tetratricopeptide (TPR) repeat protein